MSWAVAGPIIASAAVTMIGSVMANQSAKADRKATKKALDDAKAQFDQISPPTPETEALWYEELAKVAPDFVPEKFAPLVKKAQVEGYVPETYTPQTYKADNYEATGYDVEGYTPAQIEDSLMQGITVDPELKSAQMGALGALKELGQGGMSLQDELDTDRAKRNIYAESQREQQNIINNLSQRGVASGGLELAARMSSAQQAADKSADAEAGVQAEARQRALEALMQGGSLAGSMRSQAFGEDAAKATAQDAINKFRSATMTDAAKYASDMKNQSARDLMGAQNQASQYNAGANNSASQYNTGSINDAARFGAGVKNDASQFLAGARNQSEGNYINAVNDGNKFDITNANNAKLYNQQEDQRIADANVGIRNTGTEKNADRSAGAKQQDFNNKMSIATGKSGMTGALTNYYGQKTQDSNNMFGGIMQGVNQGIGAYAQYKGDQEDQAFKAKENEKDREAYGYKTKR